MKLKISQTAKLKLSSTLRSWLPILQCDIESLEKTIEPFVEENPFIEVKSGFERYYQKDLSKGFTSDYIESLTTAKNSLYDFLYEQIVPPLFPTKISQKIAYVIIDNIDKEGYFRGNYDIIKKETGFNKEQIEKIRERFSYLDPIGVGAKDIKESFLFQLNDVDIDEKLYGYCKKLILNFENIENFSREDMFQKAIEIIRRFKNPPAIEFIEEGKEVIPDIFIYSEEDSMKIAINGDYYPEIRVELNGVGSDSDFVKQKLRSAKDLIDALEMRKATLYKIGLMILEYQYEFFQGGDIKPMRLKDIADDLERNPSTISRAIANKYLSCERGIIPLKEFFSVAIEEDISSKSIKEYIKDIIKNEDRKKPISDNKILKKVEEKFGIKIVRRTIAKYRNQLGIAGSSERKKLYLLQK